SEEDRFHQRRLADAAVPDEADVTDARDIDGHRASRKSSEAESSETGPPEASKSNRSTAIAGAPRGGGPDRAQRHGPRGARAEHSAIGGRRPSAGSGANRSRPMPSCRTSARSAHRYARSNPHHASVTRPA